jgi:hypothetical protein
VKRPVRNADLIAPGEWSGQTRWHRGPQTVPVDVDALRFVPAAESAHIVEAALGSRQAPDTTADR